MPSAFIHTICLPESSLALFLSAPSMMVIGKARHSETLEELVVYRALYGEGGLWVRPLDMFLEDVEQDGRVVPRFVYSGD